MKRRPRYISARKISACRGLVRLEITFRTGLPVSFLYQDVRGWETDKEARIRLAQSVAEACTRYINEQ
jgi:hypothetical protein